MFFVGGVSQAVLQSFGYQPYLANSTLSFDAYRELWRDPAVRASLLLTARVSMLASLSAALIGVGAALVIRRLDRSRGWVAGIFQSSLAVPHLVGALCMSLLLSQSGLLSRIAAAIGLSDNPSSFPALTGDSFGWAILAEYTWKEAPFIAVIALATLSRRVTELENVAQTLGASKWQRTRHVTLPLLGPPVSAGVVLVFAFTAGSYEVPYLLGRPYPATLPVVAFQYYSDTDLTSRPQAMAVAVLILVLTIAALAAYWRILRSLTGRPQ